MIQTKLLLDTEIKGIKLTVMYCQNILSGARWFMWDLPQFALEGVYSSFRSAYNRAVYHIEQIQAGTSPYSRRDQ